MKRSAPIPRFLRMNENGHPIYLVCPKCHGMQGWDDAPGGLCLTCKIQCEPASKQAVADFLAYA